MVYVIHRCKQKMPDIREAQPHIQNKPIPMEPDYQYKYHLSSKGPPHSKLLLQDHHTCIDPRTGVIYERCNRNQTDDIKHVEQYDTYRMKQLRDNHVYNTLEPEPRDNGILNSEMSKLT